jgi:hypothetical protein
MPTSLAQLWFSAPTWRTVGRSRFVRLDRIGALAAGFAMLFIAAPAFAQTTGQLRGTVVDADEFGIPRVTLTLEGTNLIGGKQTKSTDEEGNYVFVELPPGDYTLVASKDGFSNVRLEGIQVLVGRTTSQNVSMKSGGAGEELTVEGTRPVVDVENVTRGQVLTKEFLERIPTGRSYQAAVQLANGVVGGANPNMGGANFNENTYMLDGANITDPVTGTFSANFNFDAIQNIEVLLGGFMPEYGQSLGGVINLVTESGSNNLKFDTSAFYTNGNWGARKDARFTADGYQLGPTDFDRSFQGLQVAGKVSGPIIRDRAWFIVSYQHSRTLIANTGIPLPRDFDGHYVLGKLTLQPSSAHRISAFLQTDPSAIDNLNQSDQFVKPEAQQRQYQGGFVTQGRWQWFLGSQANLDTQVVLQKSFIEVGGVPCTHDEDLGYSPCKPGERESEVDWNTPGRLGSFGAFDSVNYPTFYFDDRWRYQASSKLSLLSVRDPLGGTHDIKAGVEGVQQVWDQLQGYNGNILYVDLNATGWDPLSFENWYRWEITGPIRFRTTGSQWNFFVQDAWKPVSNLVIKGGVRYDNAVLRNDVGDPVVAQSLWGPRLYASWDPFGDQKTKVAGGYGRFNEVGRLSTAAFTSEASIAAKLWLGEISSGGGGDFVSNQSTMFIYDPRNSLNVAHDTLRAPRSDEFNLILERQIVRDVGISTQATFKTTRNLFEPDELNVVYDQDGSSVIGSRFGDSNIRSFRLRTPSIARRQYVQWDTMLYKVESRRWFGSATYTYTLSSGTSQGSLSGSFLNDPQTQFNFGPLLATDIRHTVKAFGSWRLPTDPWNQTIGFTFVYFSGNPLERFYPSDEPPPGGNWSLRIRDRGIYTRFPPNWELGLKLTQDLDVRRGKLQLDAQLLNATNNRAPVNFLGTFYTENRLLTVARQDPLQVQLGLRYQF